MVLLVACVVALSAAGGPAAVTVTVLVLAAGLQSLAEMMQASGPWELSFGLAPPGKYG